MTSTKAYKFNTIVTVTAAAAEDGMKFSHWTNGAGQTVSYLEEYKFFMGALDIELTANYVQTEETLVKQPVITITSDSRTDVKKLAIYTERYLPEEYTLIEAGMLIYDSADFDFDTAGVIKRTATQLNNNQFLVNKTGVEQNPNWYVKGYMFYKDSSGTLYEYVTDSVLVTYQP